MLASARLVGADRLLAQAPFADLVQWLYAVRDGCQECGGKTGVTMWAGRLVFGCTVVSEFRR